MKTLLLFLLLFVMNMIAYSSTNLSLKKDSLKSDSLFINKILLIQEKIIREDSLIKSLEIKVHDLDIQKGFFSNEITILTGLYSAIVAIAIFLMGYIIPNINEKKYKTEIENLKSDFNEIKNNIEESRDVIKDTNLRSDLLHAKTMYFSCDDSKNTTGRFLWAIRYISICLEYYNENFNPEEYIAFATWFDSEFSLMKNQINADNKKDYLLHVEEVNELSKKIIEKTDNEDLRKNIENMRNGFNKIVWT